MYLADDLLASIKTRASMPTAQGLYPDEKILAVASEETVSYVLPLIRRAQEDYYLQSEDFPIDSTSTTPTGAQYRIPYRAAGGTLRSVYVLDANGNPMEVPRIAPEDIGAVYWGAYFLGNTIFFINRTSYATPVTLRMTYYLRPSQLVTSAGAARISGVDLDTRTVTVTAVPASMQNLDTFDFLRGRPGFEMLGFDYPGGVSGTTVVFTDALPGDLEVGDYLCVPETTPIPQIPAELHPLLAERVAFRLLQSQDPEAAASYAQTLSRMEQDALVLVTQRMGSNVKKIVPRHSPWRRWGRRW